MVAAMVEVRVSGSAAGEEVAGEVAVGLESFHEGVSRAEC